MAAPHEIVTTFQNWRRNKLTQEHPEFATMDNSVLTVPKFLALSTFDPDTQIDIVKTRAEQYFIDLVTYHVGDLGLKALTMTKPTLNADLVALIQDPAITQFFTEYSPLWLLQAIYHHEVGPYKSDIKGGSVEDEMFAINRGNIFIRITMMLYHIALKELVPELLPYIYWSDLNVFQQRVRVYFNNADNTRNWMIKAIQCQDASVSREPRFFNAYLFNELKTKLDLLQPNNRLSNDLLGVYMYSLLSYYATKNLINSPVNRRIIIRSNEIILQRITSNPANTNNPTIATAMSALACDLPTFIGKMSTLVAKMSLEVPFEQVVPTDSTFQSSATPFDKQSLATTEFSALQDDAAFIRFANAIFCACHVGVLAYGILNGQNQVDIIKYDPSLVYVGEGLFIYKYADGIDQGRVFTVMGDFLRKLTNEMAKDATDVFSAYQNFIPNLVLRKTNQHIMRLVPSLYILTRDQQAHVLFTKSSDEILDWSELVIDLHIMDENEIDNCVPGLFTVLKKASCAGPSTALILGVGLYGLSVCSRVFPQLEMTFKLYKKALLTNSTAPDPIDQFIDSVDEDLRINYDNDQFDHSGWESYHESLDPIIQKGLDILIETENDHLNDMFKLLGEMEKRAIELEYNKVRTQIVTVANHVSSVTSGAFTRIEGSQTNVVVSRPSKIIAMVQFFSGVLNNPNGGVSVDVTSALNNQIMTNGGMNSYPWPTGTSISHCRDLMDGFSITQEIVQPGTHQYEIRARIRAGAGTANINAPGVVLFIVPFRVDGYELNYRSDGNVTYTKNGALLWTQQWMSTWSDYLMFKTSDGRVCLVSYMDANGFISGDILTDTGFTPLLRSLIDQNLDFQYFTEFSNKKDVIVAMNKNGGRKYYTIDIQGATLTEFTPCCGTTSELYKKFMDLEKRLSKIETSKVTTQVVKVNAHGNPVSSADWQPINGSQAQIVISRPSKVVAVVQYHSSVNYNSNGTVSIDVTSAINGNIMTNGGLNSEQWPVGVSMSQCRDWTNGVSVTSDTLQPGFYQYDIRARLRFAAGNVGSCNGPAALIFIMPFFLDINAHCILTF
ncbi:hypothetical protein DFA_04901 [Cavenderia fasciculata]|uniref:Uncharacterized protein n=1 Tax=Cavenderia fasciculata TaxID=261658 RepID=F4PMC1_CACFS|nr:uncharacterized protein DFA_04901 [Cavenderia fasciculata]EGG22771.1 hypothetical protein DFA_04901 [Cavenderia fasciculata]|eukprot:XP_004360622.1 hypothetical protein DFA_04901 [Cavenderia fasciculata]